MDARDVSSLHDSMRRYGIPGFLVPKDPQNPGGPWRVVDHDGAGPRQDITDNVLAAVDAAKHRRPERGFVITK